MARALYIHWPFCARKCPYCDFNSHVRAAVDHDMWHDALLADMRHEATLTAGEPLESIFFGGGTPSLMPPALVEALLREAEALWGFTPGIEVTLEGNPSSVEAANYADLAAAGINRASLGLQSLEDEALRFLGRLHDAREGMAALDVAQRHFARVSFDLIYALPGQTPDHWRSQLERALAFGTGHLSLYQLTIEPGTRFETDVRLGKLTPMGDEQAADLYELTQDITDKAGIPGYEVSNHARPGEESCHNLTYWRYRDYVGIGPGAHGRRAGCATLRHKKPENWLASVSANGHGLAEERPLSQREQASEALMMGLRLAEGIDLAEMSQRFAIPIDDLIEWKRFYFYTGYDLVCKQGDRIMVSARGMALLDALLGVLIPEQLVLG